MSDGASGPASDPRRAVAGLAEAAARDSYGRLVAIVARRTGDIAAAEDALADAFVAALKTWPKRRPGPRPARRTIRTPG